MNRTSSLILLIKCAKFNTGIGLLTACWAFKLLLQFVVRTNDKFLQKNFEYIALISPLTVIVDCYSIVARKTEYACGNSMHLLIEFLLESQASLNKRAVQLRAWLRIFVSARSKEWPVSTQCEAIRDAFTLQFLIAGRCSLILVTSLREVCPVQLLEQSLLCRWSMTVHSGRFDRWFSLVGCARFLLVDGQLRFRVAWEGGRLLRKCLRCMGLLATSSVVLQYCLLAVSAESSGRMSSGSHWGRIGVWVSGALLPWLLVCCSVSPLVWIGFCEPPPKERVGIFGEGCEILEY